MNLQSTKVFQTFSSTVAFPRTGIAAETGAEDDSKFVRISPFASEIPMEQPL